MMLAGLGWLAFLSPPLASHLSLYIKILGILAEGRAAWRGSRSKRSLPSVRDALYLYDSQNRNGISIFVRLTYSG